MKDGVERGDDQRRLSRDRLRAGFLAQATRQLGEMAVLLESADASVRDSAVHELERIAETADTFALDEVAAAARVSTAAVAAGGARESLVGTALAIRATGARSRFPPIVIVVQEPLLGRLQAEAQRCCELIEFFESVDAMRRVFRSEDPEALVVPYDALAALGPEDLRVGVYVYGPPDDLVSRRRAAAAGVVGFLPERVEFRGLLEMVRARAFQRRAFAPRALVLHDDVDLRGALAHDLEEAGVASWASRRVDDIVNLLKEAGPDVVVVGTTVGDVPAGELAEVVRAYPRFAETTLVALAEAAQHVALLDHGFDAVLDPRLPAEEMGRRTRALMNRGRKRASGRDPSTGLLHRAGVLAAVDRAISEARRGGRPLSVAVVELDGLVDVNRRHGRGSADSSMRILARCIESAIRVTDLVGRIAGDSFLVLFPACNAEQARRRLVDIRSLFAALVAREERLAGLTFSAGVADTEDGIDRLLSRAEETLERVRARDARGAVG
jgi:diguanylate cyclase (GGDEF)-like protein